MKVMILVVLAVLLAAAIAVADQVVEDGVQKVIWTSPSGKVIPENVIFSLITIRPIVQVVSKSTTESIVPPEIKEVEEEKLHPDDQVGLQNVGWSSDYIEFLQRAKRITVILNRRDTLDCDVMAVPKWTDPFEANRITFWLFESTDTYLSAGLLSRDSFRDTQTTGNKNKYSVGVRFEKKFNESGTVRFVTELVGPQSVGTKSSDAPSAGFIGIKTRF